MTVFLRSRLQGVATRLRGLAAWLHRRLGPHAVLLLTLAAGLLPALALTLASAGVYEAVAEADGIAGLDQPALEAAMGLRSPPLDSTVTAFTNLAGPVGLPVLAGTAALVLCLRQRSWRPFLLVAAAAAGSLALTAAGKSLIGRHRPALDDAVPPYEYSASFPSGHTLNSVVIAGTLAYLCVLYLQAHWARTLAVAGAAVFTVAVGLSRVYLGHHWLTDVLVAWCLGLAWLAIVITADRLLHTRRSGPGRTA